MVVDEVVKRYRSGGCFAMAQALHRLTGFPVRCIDYGSCVHAFVVPPEGDVLDIHGRIRWPDYLAFLVSEKKIHPSAVEQGLVVHQDITELADSIGWRDMGYAEPTETAIRNAMEAARRHPNLQGCLPEKD